MKLRFFGLPIFAIAFLGVASNSNASCLDGTVATCMVDGQPGTRECENGDWGPCLVEDGTEPPPLFPMVLDVSAATVISEYTVDLPANIPVSFLATNLSPGSDVVLHLFNASGQEVAMAGSGGVGVPERITYTPSTSGNYRVIVRARSNTTSGTCDVTMNNAGWKNGVVFAGWKTTLRGLRAKEWLETVKVPNGAQGTHLLFVLKPNGLGIETRGYGNGTAGAAVVSLPTRMGNRAVVVGVNRWAVPGRARLVRNDFVIAAHDPDRDGLGRELEKQLGTCSALSGVAIGPGGSAFNCSRATDPRDTDGDGISDRWEVLGLRDEWPHQPLPLFGANPRHKDLFVEFDFMQRSPGEAEIKMTPATARKFADYYGDRIGTVSAERQMFRASTLRNPDGRPGISVHLDIGVVPTDPADATLFGDWGGHNIVPPVQDEEGNWKGLDYTVAWQTNLEPARLGIFRHSSSPASGGASNDTNNFAFSAGINGPWGLAHESGHAQGLGHSGSTAGVVDPNCKPNYQSMMNYAFQETPNEVGFSDGLETGPLNNAALKEWEAVPPSNTSYIAILQNVFRYYVDPVSGHVDWNRDGEFAPAGTTVRAYANYNPTAAGCEYTRYNAMDTSGTTTVSPAIGRIWDRTYAFWAGPSSISYKWTSSSLNCPVPDTAPCATWNGLGTVPIAGAQGIDAVLIGGGASTRLLLVAVNAAGRLCEARLEYMGGGGAESWSAVTVIDPNEAVIGEPSIVAMNGCDVILAYKAADGALRTRRTNCDSNWTWLASQPGSGTDGARLALSAAASPALASGYVPSKGSSNVLLGAFISANDNRLRLYTHDSATSRWELSPDLETTPLAVGRPAIAWVPFGESDHLGRLYLVYQRANDYGCTMEHRSGGRGFYRWMWSYVKVTKDASGNVLSKQGRIGLDTWFDNVWFGGYGLDLLYQRGVDTNLRSLSADWCPGGVYLRPKADGIQDYSYANFNDWAVHRVGLCQHVVNPGGTVNNPITCPDW